MSSYYSILFNKWHRWMDKLIFLQKQFKLIKDEKKNIRCKGGNDLQEIDIKVAWSGYVSTGTDRATSSRKAMRSAPPHRSQLSRTEEGESKIRQITESEEPGSYSKKMYVCSCMYECIICIICMYACMLYVHILMSSNGIVIAKPLIERPQW